MKESKTLQEWANHFSGSSSGTDAKIIKREALDKTEDSRPFSALSSLGNSYKFITNEDGRGVWKKMS